MHYDLDGNKVSIEQWGMLRTNSGNRIIKQENINGYFVSTVWFGMDLSYSSEKPLVFETMVFKQGDWMDLYCDRYSTRGDAIRGHLNTVNKLKSGKLELIGEDDER